MGWMIRIARTQRILTLAALALTLGACATQRVRFQPWQGVDAKDLPALKRGDYAVDKAQLVDAAAATLEHEPFLHWTLSRLDKANGLIDADAGVFRELQLRVSDSPDQPGYSRLNVNIPRRALNTRAKVWDCHGRLTAYEPKPEEIDGCTPVAAPAQLDAAYLRAFTWHVLHDRVQVPFILIDHEDGEDDGAAAAEEHPERAAACAPAPASEAAPTSATAR